MYTRLWVYRDLILSICLIISVLFFFFIKNWIANKTNTVENVLYGSDAACTLQSNE